MTEEDAANALRVTLSGLGWREIMSPAGLQRKNVALASLALNKDERQKSAGTFKDKTDDELRSIIQEADWWLTFWINQLKSFDFNRQQEELLRHQQNGGEPVYPNPVNP